MSRSIKRGQMRKTMIAVIVLAILLSLSIAPVVEYRLTVSNPYFGPDGTQMDCSIGLLSNGSSIQITTCTMVTAGSDSAIGFASVSYALFGIGTPPFPSFLTVGGEQFYAFLHLSGSKISSAETIPGPDTVYNPTGISLVNSTVAMSQVGIGNVTITLANGSTQDMVNSSILISIPGTSQNSSVNGITWMFLSPGTLGGTGTCPRVVPPGGLCSVTLRPVISALPGTNIRFTVEARGVIGGRYFVAEWTRSYTLPPGIVNQEWVGQFIGLVNSARNGTQLTESASLDRFAAVRFATASSEPDFSDYGFSTDTLAFFGPNATSTGVAETLLYPEFNSPASYATYLQEYGPGHWSALTSTQYSHFGYYIGYAPYEVVGQPCPISEIPSAGLNITQFFEQAGCSVSEETTTWLVVVLGT